MSGTKDYGFLSRSGLKDGIDHLTMLLLNWVALSLNSGWVFLGSITSRCSRKEPAFL